MNGQWNDSVAIAGEYGLFRTWWTVFDQMRYDRAWTPRRITYVSDQVNAYFQRPAAGSTSRVTTTKAITDAPYVRLRDVSCNAPVGYGNTARKTVITVNMRAWYGTRGERLAGLLALHRRNGCQVRVIGSLMSREVVRILLQARIGVKSADWDWGPRPSTSDPDDTVYGPSCYSHLKYVTINGTYKGRGDRLVWTGSENWSPPSFSNDEVTFRFTSKSYYTAYTARFNKMWDSPRATHRIYLEPKTRPCA